MKETDFDTILKNAEKCYKNKIKWHFHIRMPTCVFNKKDRLAIICENEKTKEHLVSFFDERPLKYCEKLEALFYGRV